VRTMPFSALLRYTYDSRRSRTELLGIPFSFVPGILDGVSTARVHRVAAEAVERRETWSASGRLQWSRGLTNSDTSLGESAADARFNVAGFSGAFVRQLRDGWGQLRARLDAQYTRDRLLPFETLAMGGATTVRGYRENLLLRDTGAIGSIEWRTRDFTFWSERVVVGAGTFIDAGWGRDSHGVARNGPASIASVGIALRGELWRRVTAGIAWALPRDRWLTERRDIQDRGLHYSLAVSWP
jgi:hemolysin activation/secretion protein